MNRAFNFSAGPSMLPTEVMEQVKDEFLDYQGTGMSIMEMSHRWNFFEDVLHQSFDRLRKLASIPERFDILYMTGGASTQFALIPMNLTTPGGCAGYVHTGVWSKKAIDQVKIQNIKFHIAGSSEESGFDRIPDELDIPEDLDYLHLTSNNTIYGTQFNKLPHSDRVKLAIDMSSDFLSMPIDWTDIGIVYAGMQKNAGPSGTTVVVIDRELYKREKENTPSLFRYSTYAASESMYNTPPTFQIYIFNLILQWLESRGGLSGIAEQNRKKASRIYEYIDSHPEFFRGHSRKEDRSLMNVTFNLVNRDLEMEMVRSANERKLWGLKGHRLVGGLRASIYNAMPPEGCDALVEFLEDFRKNHS